MTTMITTESAHSAANDALASDQLRRNKASGVVLDNIFWSAWAGMIPMPVLDLGFISAVQMKMAYELSVLYEVPFIPTRSQAIILSLIGSSSSVLLVGATKMIPILGSISSMFTLGLYGSASTYAIGQILIEHFEKGGTLNDLDASAEQQNYAKHYKEGEAVTRQARDQLIKVHGTNGHNGFDKLKPH